MPGQPFLAGFRNDEMSLSLLAVSFPDTASTTGFAAASVTASPGASVAAVVGDSGTLLPAS